MILDEIIRDTEKRVIEAKKRMSMEQLKENAFQMPKGKIRFEQKLRYSGMSFICEVKKASPSKGIISHEFPYQKIAKQYEMGGADCISCLTEPKWFLGSDKIFCDIRKDVSIPMLRKDFTIDEYQIYEAKCMGADAVLLICSLLDTKTLFRYLRICDELGISALVETHDEKEVDSAVLAGAKIIGINNRNLNNFTVDFSNVIKLRDKIPSSALIVAESGVTSKDDIELLKSAEVDAVLIGEALMRSKDKVATLKSFQEVAK